MGMDVSGKHPTSDAGSYFRNNVWWWRPLANYIIEVAPEIAAHCTHWHSNDGDGLNKKQSIALAAKLQTEIDSGRCEAFAKIRESELKAIPNEPCRLCDGTGIRRPIPETGAGDLAHGGLECNACDGSGSVRPFDTWYPFDVENVRQFTEFLRGCGGFQIC